MLNCFAAAEGVLIPITPLTEAQFDSWSQQQSERVRNWIESTGFKPKGGSVGLLCDPQGKLERVLVVLKQENEWSIFGQLAVNLPLGVYQIDSPFSPDAFYRAALAWGMGSYQFTLYKKGSPLLAKLALPENFTSEAYLEAILSATYLVRDLINTPADDMTPADLGEAAETIADEFGAEITTIVGDDLLVKGYPSIYTVGKASEHPPRLIDLRWGNPTHPKVTLVGKGVCFDSGGLDIKNAGGMALMKKDMAGAAHALGLARIIMALKLPVRLRMLIPAVENAISGNAYHPGDVIMTRKGISVEITNTDAEGRVVLSDALCEASTEKPVVLIDFASLTGAARVALGSEISALFSNDNSLVTGLNQSSQTEGDPIWRLPLYASYKKLLDSKIADMTNASSSGLGGAITAALFLKEFVAEGIPWAHFDIMAWNVSSRPGAPEGGEAMGLRTVARYLYDRFATK